MFAPIQQSIAEARKFVEPKNRLIHGKIIVCNINNIDSFCSTMYP